MSPKGNEKPAKEKRAKKSEALTSAGRISLMPRSRKEQEILRERAEALAREKVLPESESKESYLLFRLGESEQYGIPWSHLVEVMPHQRLAAVPGTPSFVTGVFNRRGKILAVLNIHELIGVENSDKEVSIIIIKGAGMIVGIMVNELMGSQSYDPKNLAAPLASHKGTLKSDYVIGIDRGKTTLLDMDILLQDPALRVGSAEG
ncbi:MAG: chemotaxis protein CheW [Mariprofundaceae bacterium]